ncbi:HAD-superfamily subfamily IB hydrolase, TIGR01490 [Pseudoxanthomonas sp. GM95]|uniref:HAD-IB family hydrolase n=1 Tax=Pseudoxanthomonas sp. GM95 TaxID=1881043 RepID=UPI0008BB52AD|nr:HAD-IB family hydrolase [Pseudoxanthomonas sp. GM95]SEK87026.1 HAD-superfamily subfamily IB hydrolase, TIGR01490 [Pseudoxanthomonas sp. GM95]
MDLALFDFDHTLTTRDSYADFLRSIATPEQLARAKWNVAPWLLAYRTRLISAEAIRARVTRNGFSGRAHAEIRAAGQRYAHEVLPTLLRPRMREQLDWHQQRGDTVVVVSASLDAYLQPWCASLGVAMICNQPEHRDGVCTGRYAGGDLGRHKVQRIRAQYDIARYRRIHAYGDSGEDKAMLALAHERWYRGRLLT